MLPYRRILLKLSGEALVGNSGFGVSMETAYELADEIRQVRELGVQIALVIGAGNFFRGADISQDREKKHINRVTVDYMGMLATVINALAFQDSLEKNGVQAIVQSAISMEMITEPFIRKKAVNHLENGRVVLFAGGTGSPYFTTDTAASLRALEIEADVLFKGTKVNGVYASDPMTDSNAKRFAELTYMDVLTKNLKVMDATAVSLCRDNRIPIMVFNATKRGNIIKAVKGEMIGTMVKEVQSA